MNGFYPLVIEKLKAAGYWYAKPGKGSHEFWTNGKRFQLVSFNIDSRHTANGIRAAVRSVSSDWRFLLPRWPKEPKKTMT